MIAVFCVGIRSLSETLFVEAAPLVGLAALSRVAVILVMSRHKQSLVRMDTVSTRQANQSEITLALNQHECWPSNPNHKP